MKVLKVIEGTVVDGPGLRTSIYFAGCVHKCPECHNPQSWDMASGVDMSVDDLCAIVEENGFNVTFTGGDPLCQIDSGLLDLAARIRATGKTIWCYTGYTIEEIEANPRLSALLNFVDVIVDGRFVKELRSPELPFRGSSNQRIIDLPRGRNVDNS